MTEQILSQRDYCDLIRRRMWELRIETDDLQAEFGLTDSEISMIHDNELPMNRLLEMTDTSLSFWNRNRD